jgi:CheY-like chemotaxis protein
MTSDAGGKLDIESSLGQGTCITLSFPAIGQPSTSEASAHPIGKVLVVDDQADVLDITAQLFRLLGYEVISANSGADALDALRRHADIDVLFSDLVMPGMTGLQLAYATRQAHPDTEIILATGHPTSMMRQEHPGLEQFRLLGKPYTLEDIARLLDRGVHCVS